MSRTFIMIKPDGMPHGLEIGSILGVAGLSIVKFEIRNVTEDELRRHYEEYAEYPFFPYALGYLLNGPVGLGVFQGVEAINRTRRLTGVTRPWEAEPHTIRARFGATRSQEEADRESGNIRNAMHCSDSPEAYSRETATFFPDGVD